MEFPMALSPEALTLIRQWEGCRLSAYPDPASGGEPWTIGYGHTGPEVTAGLTISRGAGRALAARTTSLQPRRPWSGCCSRRRD